MGVLLPTGECGTRGDAGVQRGVCLQKQQAGRGGERCKQCKTPRPHDPDPTICCDTMWEAEDPGNGKSITLGR